MGVQISSPGLRIETILGIGKVFVTHVIECHDSRINSRSTVRHGNLIAMGTLLDVDMDVHSVMSFLFLFVLRSRYG